jgi:dTDP-4-dehydrorhamnose reductase
MWTGIKFLSKLPGKERLTSHTRMTDIYKFRTMMAGAEKILNEPCRYQTDDARTNDLPAPVNRPSFSAVNCAHFNITLGINFSFEKQGCEWQ